VSITATIKTFPQRIADTIMHSTANIEEMHITVYGKSMMQIPMLKP